MPLESDNNIPDVTAIIRSIKNSVLKEYLCLKKPKLLTNLVANNFPVPHPVIRKKINYIDVDTISTDTCNSSQEDCKYKIQSCSVENVGFSYQNCSDKQNNIVPKKGYQQNSNEMYDFDEECNAKYWIFEEEPFSLDCSLIRSKLNKANLTMEDHYSKFLPMQDKKSKAILEVIATFEQQAFGSTQLQSTAYGNYQGFLRQLKIVLVILMADWSVKSRYQKCDHIAACLIIMACMQANIPKKFVMETFRSFDNECFKNIKIRLLKKTKFYVALQDMLRTVMS